MNNLNHCTRVNFNKLYVSNSKRPLHVRNRYSFNNARKPEEIIVYIAKMTKIRKDKPSG